MENNTEDMNEKDQIDHLLRLHGDILAQLLKYERFNMFLSANYDVHLDEETKTFQVREFTNSVAKENVRTIMEKQQEEASPIITLSKG